MTTPDFALQCIGYRSYIPIELRRLIESYLYEVLDNNTIQKAIHFWCLHKEFSLLRYGPISYWNTAHVTCMKHLLYYHTSFNEDINNWDVSNVTDMSYMFYGASTFNHPLSTWNVSKVVNMAHMFEFATSFHQSLEAWNFRSDVSIDEMFGCCSSRSHKTNKST
jgi:surface protein